MTTIDAATVLRRSRDVRFRTVLDEGVVIQQKSAEVLVLNEVGARTLELLDGKRSVADVERVLVGEFEASPETIAADLATYLAELVSIGVVEPRPGPADPDR
jgi:hypothetical protein